MDKAVAHARARMREGLSPFANDGPLPTLQRAPVGKNTIDDEGVERLGYREAFMPEPYQDSGTGLAIGYGMHSWKGKPVTPGMVVTEDEAKEEMRRQVKEDYGKRVNAALKVQVSQRQFDELVSLAWNHFPTAQRAINKLNAGQPVTADDLMWSATVKGKPHEGLRARRAEELEGLQDTGTPVAAPRDPTDTRDTRLNLLPQLPRAAAGAGQQPAGARAAD